MTSSTGTTGAASTTGTTGAASARDALTPGAQQMSSASFRLRNSIHASGPTMTSPGFVLRPISPVVK
ncbi:MAG: hypothetical protein JST54_20530 [Deltaproteobacteria bacterium]|nr:hypothetical protein [Deltaproteobacteria bacterium]